MKNAYWARLFSEVAYFQKSCEITMCINQQFNEKINESEKYFDTLVKVEL